MPATPVDVQLRPVLSVDPASIADNPCPTDLPAPVPTEIVVSPGCTDGVIDDALRPRALALDGSAFESARAVENQNTGEWVVNPVLTQGAAGIDAFNAVAAHCYAKDSTCPTGQLAIVVDGIVISAPTIQTPSVRGRPDPDLGRRSPRPSATALAAGIDAAG